MPLKAKKPEVVKAVKPKVILYGLPGVGKTWMCLDAPGNYYIDTEGGAVQPQYREKLKKAGAMYFGKEEGSQDLSALVNEVKALATEQHPYKTLTVDSYSKAYGMAIAASEARGVTSEFAKSKQDANKATRQLQTWLERVDLTVFLVCHAKEKWQGGSVTGYTFDGLAKLEHDLDLSLEVTRKDGKTIATVRKTRLLGFPEGASFELSWAEFAKRAGDVIERAADVFTVATDAQVKELKALLDTIKVPEGWEEKALAKEGVTDWAEMASERIQAAINALKKSAQGTEAKS
jgi:RecA/RadA recombinase